MKCQLEYASSIEIKENAMIFFHHTSCLSVVKKTTTSSIGHSSKFPSFFNMPPSKVSLHMILDLNGVLLKMKFNVQHGCVSQNQKAPPHFV